VKRSDENRADHAGTSARASIKGGSYTGETDPDESHSKLT
jgi:hypothetical protein